ncbi:hypothetical protein A1O1_02458 [Capronia coronata CBS 617.96]|uniref:Uncharacterized protein n=1 Tax=Capronia coronata CBS 617.96 TaxID=1182541 RepID=W9YWK8_9EURO|nr:uncharacterized protein A1O1_02458 [Capronia coronata CBS 617.96]EXJ94065.1 hypothetical protein A1O1_02458 [Capronia coronata CBS 617.96]
MCLTILYRSRCAVCSEISTPDAAAEKLCEPDEPCASRNVRPLRYWVSESAVPCAGCLTERLERELFLLQLESMIAEGNAAEEPGKEE